MAKSKINEVQEIPVKDSIVLFRVWMYDTKKGMKGIIDLCRNFGSGAYLDSGEAIIESDEYGVFRLAPRKRGKDLPEEMYPIIEISLLAPLSVGTVELWKGHLFGKGELHEILLPKAGIIEFKLKNLKIIPPKEYEKISYGGQINRDSPNKIPKTVSSSYENFQSRLFEIATAKYLQDQFNYDTQTGFKPKYLKGKEIDVFAEKGIKQKKITVCECKLRFNDRPITLDEIEYFHKKIKLIEKNETLRSHVQFQFWFVTNTEKQEKDVPKFAKKHGIKLKKAHISKNWKKRSDWAVGKITDI